MRTLMLVLLAGLAGCGDVRTDWAGGTQDPPPPQVTVLHVQQCWLNEEGDEKTVWFGAGFRISSSGIITYRHQLPPSVTEVLVEGEVASVLDRGNDEREWDDWIYVRIRSTKGEIPIVDPKLELRPGERVAIVGFPASDATTEELLDKFWATPCKTAYGEIASKPFWLGIPDDIVLIKAGDASLKGMSGGPVMVLRNNEWVVVGVYVGVLYRDILKGVFSSRLRIARRIPEHLLEK